MAELVIKSGASGRLLEQVLRAHPAGFDALPPHAHRYAPPELTPLELQAAPWRGVPDVPDVPDVPAVMDIAATCGDGWGGRKRSVEAHGSAAAQGSSEKRDTDYPSIRCRCHRMLPPPAARSLHPWLHPCVFPLSLPLYPSVGQSVDRLRSIAPSLHRFSCHCSDGPCLVGLISRVARAVLERWATGTPQLQVILNARRE